MTKAILANKESVLYQLNDLVQLINQIEHKIITEVNENINQEANNCLKSIEVHKKKITSIKKDYIFKNDFKDRINEKERSFHLTFSY
ncbi:hypothetical protein [Fredinandcohnia quinoae]|uniref:Uncharacterized protein n=1 Tax=Fredinandcohnia quinoae TaxID=2918902 RepID=A0AAW5DZF6_9BACI|nr:hypothetical protein [Fredinandcohnia sp. SECRCQ15]MCH1624704.1 hypothetical protein [Fredinandcohnia sp. SECRCQ15]